MPISGTSTDYSNRTKDIHIFQGVDVNKLSAITPSFGHISNYCTGIQKLVQRYGISLLTELGSQPAYPDFGSDLIPNLTNRNMNINKADLVHIFNFANMVVLTSFRDYQRQLTTVVPDDEKLATAVLRDISIIGDTVSLVIEIFPIATEPVIFILPIPSNN